MTITEAANLAEVIKRETGEPVYIGINSGGLTLATADWKADDWEPVYEKVEVEHGTFPWAMYMWIDKGMDVECEDVDLSRGFYAWLRNQGPDKVICTFSRTEIEGKWKCREPE